MLGAAPGAPDIFLIIGQVFESIIGWLGEIVEALFGVPEAGSSAGTLSALLPLVAIPVACAVIFLAIKVVKKISWGY